MNSNREAPLVNKKLTIFTYKVYLATIVLLFVAVALFTSKRYLMRCRYFAASLYRAVGNAARALQVILPLQKTEAVPNNMYGLVSFFTALWLSSAAAQLQFPPVLTDITGGIKTAATTELQTGIAPIGETIAFIGGVLCGPVKKVAGVTYEDYENNEPDMSNLTIVMITGGKTVIYNLTTAAEEILKDNVIDPSIPLVIFFHGFTGSPYKQCFQGLKNAFATQEATNGKVTLFAVDASSLTSYYYIRATTLVRYIADKCATLLAALVKALYLDPAKIYLIGHSLGAHICGFVGKLFQILTGLLLGRVTGLDPAGPCFSILNATLRLAKSDATFVDIIHTNGGTYGISVRCGHVDFYPNGGSEQPGCVLPTCSHSRVCEYIAESVLNATAFPAVKCNSFYDFRNGNCDYNDTNYMGYGTCLNSSGTYYLQTFDKSPYGAGEQGKTYTPNGLVRGISNGFEDVLMTG